MNSVPFRKRYLLGKLARVDGVARLEHDALVLEFSCVDALVGVLRSGLKEVRIGLADLESIDLRRGWFADKLRIVARRVSVLKGIPVATGPELNLKCRKRHRLAAQELTSAVRLRATELQLEALRGAAQQGVEADKVLGGTREVDGRDGNERHDRTKVPPRAARERC